MLCKKRIAILLATYNGEAYLSEQLDSLLKQTHKDFEVFIRDDGSSDTSIEIVNEYCKKYPDTFHLIEDKVHHRGARDSFMYLLKNVEAEYYMFCDQDDVWLPFKIEKSFDALRNLEKKIPGKPALIGTDLRVVDENLNTIYESFWVAHGVIIDLRQKFSYQHLGGMFAGCTQIFNKSARQSALPIHPKAIMHDAWLTLCTSAYGKCGNIKTPTILYRQHDNNSIGCDESAGVSQYGNNYLKRFYACYYDRKETLEAVNYGSVYKAIFFKSIYLFCILWHRLFKR